MRQVACEDNPIRIQVPLGFIKVGVKLTSFAKIVVEATDRFKSLWLCAPQGVTLFDNPLYQRSHPVLKSPQQRLHCFAQRAMADHQEPGGRVFIEDEWQGGYYGL